MLWSQRRLPVLDRRADRGLSIRVRPTSSGTGKCELIVSRQASHSASRLAVVTKEDVLGQAGEGRLAAKG